MNNGRRWLRREQVSSHCFVLVNQRNRLCDSNSGFINAGGGIVVDTQCDLPHAREVLQLVAEVAHSQPSMVINTHEDSDHVWGNQFFADAEIIGHRCLPERMQEVADPANIQRLTHAAQHPVLRQVLRLTKPALFALGNQLNEDYNFGDIVPTPPTTLFDDRRTITAGPVTIELTHVGPCHQQGDTIVHIPEEQIVFAGDLVFHQCTPMGWCGTFENWINAIEQIIQLKPKCIVPGHGPVCTVADVKPTQNYLHHVYDCSRAAFDRGLSAVDAARQIDLKHFETLNAPGRLSMNVERAYREFRGVTNDEPWDVPAVFTAMHKLAKFRGLPCEF